MDSALFTTLSSYQEGPSEYKPKVAYEIKGQKLHTYFECQSHNWNCGQHFLTSHNRNWGLWDYDVFEVFVQAKSHNTPLEYYEFQTSPKGEEFILKILKPRELFLTPLDITYQFKNTVQDGLWKSHFELDLGSLSQEKEAEYYGNFHAILGSKENRQFYSYNLSQYDKPDFHLPERFIKL